MTTSHSPNRATCIKTVEPFSAGEVYAIERHHTVRFRNGKAIWDVDHVLVISRFGDRFRFDPTKFYTHFSFL